MGFVADVKLTTRWLCLTSVKCPAARIQIENDLHLGWSANFGTPVCQFSVGGNRRTLQNAERLLQTWSLSLTAFDDIADIEAN